MQASGEQNRDIALSVIIPCYNHGDYVMEAVASVESCQESVYEIIIINDGSTDPITQKVLSYLATKGYRVIHQENQGLAMARNRGIQEAKGDYFLPLDADNKIRPAYITKGIEILDQNPEVGVVYGHYEFFGDKEGVWTLPPFDINRIVRGNYIDACAVIRKRVWKDCGGYDDKIPDKLGYEDWDFWLGAAEAGWQFARVDEVLFDYRYKETSMVSKCNIPENHRELFRYISNKHLSLYAANFPNIFAEVECDFVTARDQLEQLESEKQKIQIELELERTKLRETAAKLQEIQAQLADAEARLEGAEAAEKAAQKQLQTLQLDMTQVQNHLTEARQEWEGVKYELTQTQSELKQTQELWELERAKTAEMKAQAEIMAAKAAILATEKELRVNLESQLQHSQAQWQHSQAQLQAVQAHMEQTRSQLERELETQLEHQEARMQEMAQMALQLQQQAGELARLQGALASTQEMVAAMETSKFWKLRSQWFKLKKFVGL